MSEPHAEPHPDLAGYVLGGLAPGEAAAFEAHLAGCAACRAEADELAPLPGLLAAAAAVPPFELPAGLRARTLAAVAAAEPEAGTRRASDEPVVVPPGSSSPARPPADLAEARRRRDERRAGRLPRLAVAAVAAVVLGAGLAMAGLGRDQRPAAAEIELVAAPGQTGRGRAVVRDTDGGRVVELEVEGLRPSPPGTYYECWFVGDGDSLESPNRVSAGTFRVGPDGRAELRLASAADLTRFPRLGVTLEPDDGDPRRTGDKVLVSR